MRGLEPKQQGSGEPTASQQPAECQSEYADAEFLAAAEQIIDGREIIDGECLIRGRHECIPEGAAEATDHPGAARRPDLDLDQEPLRDEGRVRGADPAGEEAGVPEQLCAHHRLRLDRGRPVDLPERSDGQLLILTGRQDQVTDL